ncbi:hypothetical protein CCP2SC5_770005 [Azospirillaceae bacterium]
MLCARYAPSSPLVRGALQELDALHVCDVHHELDAPHVSGVPQEPDAPHVNGVLHVRGALQEPDALHVRGALQENVFLLARDLFVALVFASRVEHALLFLPHNAVFDPPDVFHNACVQADLRQVADSVKNRRPYNHLDHNDLPD